MSGSPRSYWAWGFESRLPTRDAQDRLARLAAPLVGGAELARRPLPAIGAARLPEPRLEVPPALASIATTERRQRAAHTYGKSYPDLVRGFAGDFSPAPDVVMSPSTEDQLERILAFCENAGAAAVPYGGGTSVVGGTTADPDDRRPSVSIDLRGLSGVREVDPLSLSARIGAGATGPALEAELADHGLTLRHFPQSFELSTLGGWLATRAGGHFATRYTHIDDLTQSIRMITPRGLWQSLRVPASGAGPSPDRLALGSEGTLGIITEAWMRVRPRPDHKSSAAVRFGSWSGAVDATRALAQSRLYPDNCRLLDATEAMIHRVSPEPGHVLLLGFEAHGEPVDEAMRRALEMARDHGGELCGEIRTQRPEPEDQVGQDSPSVADSWRSAFIDAPYLLNTAVTLGLIIDTFETAVTWTGFEALHAAVTAAACAAMREQCGGGLCSVRFTHVYPDGPAPYYTVIAPGRPGAELEQWEAIKTAITDALCGAGGTVTHHHAVGRVHRPWHRAQRPAPFGEAMLAAKRAVDPAGILNPGVLW